MPTPQSSKTTIQFRLRSLLIVMTAGAILMAILSPRIREFTFQELFRFSLVWAGALLGLVGTVVFFGIWRRRAERKAGAVRHRLTTGMSWGILVLYPVLALVIFLGMLRFSFTNAWTPSPISESIVPLLTDGFLNGFLLAVFITPLWWRIDRLEIRENGIVSSWGYHPWSQIDGFCWREGDPNTLLLRVRGWPSLNRRQWEAKTPKNEKPELERFLSSRVNRLRSV
jgi:hypothetical protein